MNISRTKFVIVFLFFAVAFLMSTSWLLDQSPESLFGSASQARWQSMISTMLSPVKITLMGPLLPFINFLHQDPDTPPPFFLVGFACYWTLLALLIHFVVEKLMSAK